VGLWIVVTLFFAGLHLLSKGTSGWTVPKVAAVFHRYRCRTCRFYHRFLD
jgi:hypothetical protein